MWLLVYGLHVLFWAPFVVRGQLDRVTGKAAEKPAAYASGAPSGYVWMHGLGLLATYVGIPVGLFAAGSWPIPIALQLAGIPTILGGMLLVIRVLMVFRSWRLRAELSADHELCTEGPFRRIRHPIYTAMLLLCLGSFLLVPNVSTALGFFTTLFTGDIRARAEEKLLISAFGDRYAAYAARTKRFVPGLY